MSSPKDNVKCSHLISQSAVTRCNGKFHCPECGRAVSVNENIGTDAWTESSRHHGKFVSDTKGRLCIPFRKMLNKQDNQYPDSPSGSQKLMIQSIRNWEVRKGKRALLCGVTYDKQKYELKGTNHDVSSMQKLLISRFGFPDNSIRILAETEWHPHPTKQNIQEALRWLVKDCQAGDSLVFYFSGHGLRQPDFLDEELDGFDETICPLDFRTAGMIVDNEINDTIVRPLKSGVKLHAIIDACHSGTILDLPYVYSGKEKKWLDNSPPSCVYKGTSGGHAISLSACEDNQLAADTSVFSETGKQMEGAMTHAFRKAFREKRVTYAGLLASMHKDILEARAKCFSLRGLFHRERPQEPMLSSSVEFDVHQEFTL